MIYRRIGDCEISILGMGAMRLPLQADRKTIDEQMTDRMIRRAIERGLNYIDTAAPYHDGMSEPVLGNILSTGLRDKVVLATKQPCWLVPKNKKFVGVLDQT